MTSLALASSQDRDSRRSSKRPKTPNSMEKSPHTIKRCSGLGNCSVYKVKHCSNIQNIAVGTIGVVSTACHLAGNVSVSLSSFVLQSRVTRRNLFHQSLHLTL